jgi:hypothetical protein
MRYYLYRMFARYVLGVYARKVNLKEYLFLLTNGSKVEECK